MHEQKWFRMLIILTLLVALVGSVGSATGTRQAKAHPLLLQIATQSPEKLVSVIVQKANLTQQAEALAVKLGGKITRDLSIIHAFAAQMKATAARQMAYSPEVRWVSLDAPVIKTVGPDGTVDTSALLNTYVKTIGVDKVWAKGYQGGSIGVAVVDSGINWQTDLYTIMGQNRVVANVRFNTDYNQTTFDNYGHGSHVAGVVGGNGRSSNGKYIGVAPLVNVINVKVSNDDGSSVASSVVAGLEWILNNRAAYNIRVVNLSLNSSVAESYHISPLDAAVEVLWFNGIVVVVSAGNSGSAALYPPANDPFVITVGAIDDKSTASLSDDVIASFSAYGTTTEGFRKPDLVAPGKNIVSLMGNTNGVIPASYPGNKIGSMYFRMSGTSVAAPMVAGAAALLLEDEPNLTPDQVKYRLMAKANKNWAGYRANKAGAGTLDVYAALYGTTTESANTGIQASQLLWTGSQPVTWGSVAWNSVAWNSVAWNSVAWNSVAWNTVAWNSDYWGP